MSASRKSGENLNPEIVKEFVVSNKLGVHARPAALFVKTANRFDCEVLVEKDGEVVNGKSIMGPAGTAFYNPSGQTGKPAASAH